MNKEDSRNQDQNSQSFQKLFSSSPENTGQVIDHKQLFIVASKDLTDKLNTRFEQYANHFKNQLQLSFIESSDTERIEKLLAESITNPMSVVLTLGTHTYIEDIFFAEAEKQINPFNMGNCSTSGEELLYLGELKEKYTHQIFLTNLIQIGLQLHLSSPNFLNKLDEENFEYHRVGALKEDFTQVEPLMRDINYLRFDANSIKNSDFPAKSDFNPSGLTSEEALQTLRYAGLSPKMNLIHFTGFLEEHIDPVSLEFLAQAVWYISHGLDGKVTEDPFNSKTIQEYVIEHDYYDFPLSFLRSKKSGRWWMKIPSTPDAPFTHIAIACDAHDYQKVIEGEIPYRLLKALERGKA